MGAFPGFRLMRSFWLRRKTGRPGKRWANRSRVFRVCSRRRLAELGAGNWRRGGLRMRFRWMRITCAGRMRRFSGKAQHMEAEIKREEAGATIREFRAVDAAAATAVLRESTEAANWLEKSYAESLEWSGAVALASEVEGRVTGFIIGRQIAD